MATYKIIGQRFLRKYTAPRTSPVYAASVDVQNIVSSLCTVPWEKVFEKDATMTYHTEEAIGNTKISGLDMNVKIRNEFDAALFCAEHTGGQHRAYANAAVYRYELPAAAIGKSLTSLKLNVTSDPYNSNGARIHVMTNTTGEIPTSCRTCRGEDASGTVINDGTTASRVAVRTTQTISGKEYWYPTSAESTITPTGGLTLQKYLFVFVLMENYATVRGNWIEGSSFIQNLAEITLASAVSGWTDGDTIDLSSDEQIEVKVVYDGVCQSAVTSGVESILLQRNGDAFVKSAEELSGRDSGLYKVVAGEMTRLFGISSDEITCMNGFSVHTTAGIRNFIAIGGTFAGGSFSEIPGLYLYSIQDSRFVPEQSLTGNAAEGATLPGFLSSFAASHGGFAFVGSCTCLSTPTDMDGNGFFIVGMDGACVSYGSNGASSSPGLYPCFSFGVNPNDLRFGISPLTGNAFESGSPVVLNAFQHLSILREDAHFCGSGTMSTQLGGTSMFLMTCLLPIKLNGNRIGIIKFHYFYFCNPTNNRTTKEAACSILTKNVSGLVNSVEPISQTVSNNTSRVTKFVIAGDLQSVDSVSATHVATIDCTDGLSSNLPSLFTLGTASIPAWANTILPDVKTDYKIFGPCACDSSSNGGVPSTSNYSILVVGRFSTLGGNGYNRAAYLVFTTSSNYSLSLCEGGESVWGTVPKNAVVNYYGGRSLFGSFGGNDTGEIVYYKDVKESISDVQSAIGLRTLEAAILNSKMSSVDIKSLTDSERPGALYVVRGDTLSVPVLSNGARATVSVKTWQLTVGKLIVPVSIPISFIPRAIQLDWDALGATQGSMLNVWILRGHYLTEAPEINDPSLYDALKSEINGWERLGSFDASLTSAKINVNLGDCRVATLMFTAFSNTDRINPSSQMTLPVGVGSANVNPISGQVSGLYTGWKPDITLIG